MIAVKTGQPRVNFFYIEEVSRNVTSGWRIDGVELAGVEPASKQPVQERQAKHRDQRRIRTFKCSALIIALLPTYSCTRIREDTLICNRSYRYCVYQFRHLINCVKAVSVTTVAN